MASESKSPDGAGTGKTQPGREDRLKAALKANLGRRKAQARVRAGAGEIDKNDKNDRNDKNETDEG